MKTCPNCGSKMEADVNFCTVCGTNIKNVPLDGQQAQPQVEQPVQPTQAEPTQSQQPAQQQVPPTMDQNQSAQNVQQPTQSQQPQQSTQPQQQSSQTAQAASDAFAKVSSAVKNFDKESLWKWFVTSWKTPSADQQGEKWYGIATLLVEMILFAWSGMSGIKKIVYDKITTDLSDYNTIPHSIESRINSLVHGLGFDLFLWVLILAIGLIAVSYLINKFVHGQSVSLFDHINKIVQMSNLSVFLVIALAIVLFINPLNYRVLFMALVAIINWLFLFAGAFSIKEGPKTNRDPFYGVIIFIIAMIVVNVIAFMIVKSQLISQFQSSFNVDISSYLDLGKLLGLN